MSTQPDSKDTKPAYTPGPWSVNDRTGEFPPKLWVHRPDTFAVARVLTGQRHRLRAVANAHLIAAAPELYEALQAALAHVSELREAWARGVLREHDALGGTRSNRNVDVENLLRAALQKAEGR